MTISDFSHIARQTTAANLVVGQQQEGQNGQNGVGLRKPLHPPSAWTGFKAALSHVPVLGQIGSLRQARQEVDSYPVKLGEYQASNRQILAGFVQDLRASYGDHVANMAMKKVQVSDGAPLSQRMVKTALDSADQTQKQMRAMNNMQITRFLENPTQGGYRAPGEKDMADLCFERNLPIGGQPSWQHALGADAAKFVTTMIEGLCRSLPGHAQGMLANAQIASAASQALDLYQSLASTPDMTPARLEGILMRANQKAPLGHQAVLNYAQELAISTRLKDQLDPQNPESLLGRTATQVQDSLRGEIDALGLPPPGLDLAPVLKSISRSLNETIAFGAKQLPQQLGCADDAPSIAKALDAALPGKLEAALREHVQALTLVQQSTTLTTDQKAELLEIARTRRIDPEQVRQYEAGAADLAQALDALRAYVRGGGDPQALLARLGQALDTYATGLGAMKMHGATMWEHGSLSGGDMTSTLLDQFSKVAAGLMTPEDAKALLPLVCGAETATLAQVMQASADPRTSNQLTLVLASLGQAVAERAGETPQDAESLTIGMLRGTPAGLDLNLMRPGLALTLLTDPEKRDERGVAHDAPNAGLIAPDFDPGAVIAQNRQALVDYVNHDDIDGASGLPRTTLVDMGRATFCLNDERIGGNEETGDVVLARFQHAFGEDKAMARGVGRCMNQLGINMFVGLNNQSAYGEGNVIASTPGSGRTVHDAWRQEDGSWLVRSTHTSRPNMLSRSDGSTQEIHSTGLAAFSVTYRVTPGATPGDKAVITVEDSQVAYAI